MKKIYKKIVSLLLVIAMLFTTTGLAFATASEEKEALNFVDVNILLDDSYSQVFTITDVNNQEYRVSVDKITEKVTVEVCSENIEESSSYIVEKIILENGDEALEVTYPDGTTEIQAVAAFAIPLWMGLSTAAVEALIAVGKAIITTVATAGATAGAFVLAEELYSVMKKNSALYYEASVNIDKHLVFVGEEISRGEAAGIISINSKKKAVFCKARTQAQNLAAKLGGVKSEHNADCVDYGQWPHFHCKNFPNAHIFYPN